MIKSINRLFILFSRSHITNVETLKRQSDQTIFIAKRLSPEGLLSATQYCVAFIIYSISLLIPLSNLAKHSYMIVPLSWARTYMVFFAFTSAVTISISSQRLTPSSTWHIQMFMQIFPTCLKYFLHDLKTILLDALLKSPSAYPNGITAIRLLSPVFRVWL